MDSIQRFAREIAAKCRAYVNKEKILIEFMPEIFQKMVHD